MAVAIIIQADDKQHETKQGERTWLASAKERMNKRSLAKEICERRPAKAAAAKATATRAIIMAGIIIRIKQENTSDRHPSYGQGFRFGFGFLFDYPLFFGSWD